MDGKLAGVRLRAVRQRLRQVLRQRRGARPASGDLRCKLGEAACWKAARQNLTASGLAVRALGAVPTLAHNEEFLAGKHSWWLDVNAFADWSSEEFSAQLLRGFASAPASESRPAAQKASAPAVANPERVDWREKNVVTPVKDQGSCGSCWSFSAAESVESHYAIASGKLLQLAPQAALDCVQNPDGCGGSGGCGGATCELAFNLTVSKGLPLESDMPYARRARGCQAYKAAVRASGYVKLPVNDATALETAVATKGPVSVIVAAMPWQLYGGGIFKGCSSPLPSLGNELDHAVQVVGYGSEGGQRYWLVRNSWGSWGEKGYIRVSRDNDAKTFTDDSPREGVACKPYPKTEQVGGECGILFDASYPIGVESAAAADVAGAFVV
eukprot:TRINITY_DN16345_c0_g1_i1.p1 TRINITY_DN16345_c0_g1~~TRINITY_DN16345_c0_g1_i1.p1  ORF type:complete len:384 (+),score=76.88 TRINITY_DN16345_c0_g1_i1:153-1304(+)